MEKYHSKHDGTWRFKLVNYQLVRLIIGEELQHDAQLCQEVHLVFLKIDHLVFLVLLHFKIVLFSFIYDQVYSLEDLNHIRRCVLELHKHA